MTPSACWRPPPEAARLIEDGALVAVSHSGGKDSQAALIRVREIAPPDRIVVLHAHLGRVEWPGTIEHVRRTIGGLRLVVVEPPRDLLDMVRRRGRWPSPAIPQCRSDLKRGPLRKAIRRILREEPRFGGRVLDVQGLRAEESDRRRARPILERLERECVAGRDWRVWLPIHELAEAEVFGTIRRAGETPHPVYAKGMSRCSCSFCICATLADLRRAAELRPDLLEEYDRIERETGHMFLTPRKGEPPRRLKDVLSDRRP